MTEAKVPYRTKLVPQSESDFMAAVISIARALGWKAQHIRPARTHKGWRTTVQGDVGGPDLLLARRGHVILAELKGIDTRGKRGKRTREQEEWGEAIRGNTLIASRAYHAYQLWWPDSEWQKELA